MSSKSIIQSSYSKINPSNPQRSKRSKQRPRPHGKPQPGRYKPPAPPRPARFMLDTGKHISLLLTLERHHIAPNETTLTKIGGTE